MRQFVILALAASSLVAACGHGDAKGGGGSSGPAAAPAAPTPPPAAPDTTAAAPSAGAGSGSGSGSAAPVAAEPPPPPGHDFTPTAKLLLAVGACGAGDVPPEYKRANIEGHCEFIHKVQADYQDNWVKKARAFFAEKVPSTLPKKVVYPFAGGDLSTALTVYPTAEELTTLSLEPAGDPRTLEAMAERKEGKAGPLGGALKTVESELKFLYRVNFSNTANMMSAMRIGELPTQLIFGLSALTVHGYEVVSLRYFKLDEAGAVQYLTDAEVAAAPDPRKGSAAARNAVFANAELRFRKPGGPVQIYRHIQFNLDDQHLKKDPRVLKHLEAKGPIAAMTKAASYLLSWDTFSLIRNYLTTNAVWMVSDATGVAPKWGKAAGFEYETYGIFNAAHLSEGAGISANWRAEWKSQDQRELPFRFGYYDKQFKNHLVIMRKKPS